MEDSNQVIEQAIDHDTHMKFRFGGYLQLLLTALIVWLFYNTYSSYELVTRGTPFNDLVRIHKATGVTEIYDNSANGWVRILETDLVYTVDEKETKKTP